MATSAKSRLSARFLGGVTEGVLSRIDQPVLLVGPRVPVDVELGDPTLVVLLDSGDLAEATVPAIVSWVADAFACRDPGARGAHGPVVRRAG